MRRTALAVLLLTSLAFAQTKTNAKAEAKLPDISGNWKYSPAFSTTVPAAGAVTMTIQQSGNTIRFITYARDEELGSEDFVTDGIERTRYSGRLGTGYARAKWDKNGVLVITTRVFLDVEGNQSYSETDRWSLSPDGKILKHTRTDGKIVLWDKQAPPPTQ